MKKKKTLMIWNLYLFKSKSQDRKRRFSSIINFTARSYWMHLVAIASVHLFPFFWAKKPYRCLTGFWGFGVLGFWGFQLPILYTDYEVYLLELVNFNTRKFDKFGLRLEMSHDRVFKVSLTEISTFYKHYQSTDISEQFLDWFKYLKMIQAECS